MSELAMEFFGFRKVSSMCFLLRLEIAKMYSIAPYSDPGPPILALFAHAFEATKISLVDLTVSVALEIISEPEVVEPVVVFVAVFVVNDAIRPFTVGEEPCETSCGETLLAHPDISVPFSVRSSGNGASFDSSPAPSVLLPCEYASLFVVVKKLPNCV